MSSGSQLSRAAEGAIFVGDGDGDEDAMFIRRSVSQLSRTAEGAIFVDNGDGDGDEDGLSVLVLNERRRGAR